MKWALICDQDSGPWQMIGLVSQYFTTQKFKVHPVGVVLKAHGTMQLSVYYKY